MFKDTFTNITQMNAAARRRACQTLCWAVLALALLGGLTLALTAGRTTVDAASLALDHSGSNAAEFPAEREEIASALPLLVGHDVRVVSFGDHVTLVWQGRLTQDNLPLAQAAVRAVLLRDAAQERGTDISRMTVGETAALAALPGQHPLLYAATDGQEDAPHPLVALPPTSLEAVRRVRIVFAHLKEIPRIASLATLAGASVQTYLAAQSDGRLRQAILGQRGWEGPVRGAGWLLLALIAPLLAGLLVLRPARPRPLPMPAVTRWVGVETADGRLRALPSPEDGVLIGFGPAARLPLPADFPADTLLQATPLGESVKITYHSGRGMAVGNGAAFLRRGQSAEAVDGDALQFGPNLRVWLRVSDREPLPLPKGEDGVTGAFDTAARIT